MFPVIEHKALSTAWEIIGPECNTASMALKEIFSSRSFSSLFFNLLPLVSFILKLFFLLYLPSPPPLTESIVISLNTALSLYWSSQ